MTGRVAGMVRVNGHSLYMQCLGVGAPVVIFDSGAGNTGSVWDSIAGLVSARTRVCTYDRAGLGRSERSHSPPTAQQRAMELRSLLKAARLQKPVVLVGHSAGGLIALAYAAQRPQEVAALILVDAAPQSALGRLQSTLRPDQWNAFAKLIAEPKEGWTAEYFLASEAWLQGRNIKLRIPVIVLSRGLPQSPPPPSIWPSQLGNPWPEIEAAWQEGQRELLRVSEQSQHVMAWMSRHNIHRTEPQLVVNAVFDALELVRQP